MKKTEEKQKIEENRKKALESNFYFKLFKIILKEERTS